MQKDIVAYFENTIIPLIAKDFPQVASEMSIMVTGSFGFGLGDESSDLDANIYLDDPLWKSQGGQVQLLLEHSPDSFARTVGHPEICVHPLSWLLDEHRKLFLEGRRDLPWEQVSIEDLFELQENLVLRDPHGVFGRLRERTAPERLPDWLWQKRLMEEWQKLVFADLGELVSSVKRQRALQAQIIFGCVMEDLLHVGFLLNRKYYPWRKHLRWAFEKLPVLASSALPHLDAVDSLRDWDGKLASVEAVRDIYADYMRDKGILSPEVLDDLEWAIRLEAWSNPRWRDRILALQQKAVAAGDKPGDRWVWSLWGWN